MRKFLDAVIGLMFGVGLVYLLTQAERFYPAYKETSLLGLILSFAFGAIAFGSLSRDSKKMRFKSWALYFLTMFVGMLWATTPLSGEHAASSWWWIIGCIAGCALSLMSEESEPWKRRALFASVPLTFSAAVYGIAMALEDPRPRDHSMVQAVFLIVLAVLGALLWSPPTWLYKLVQGWAAEIMKRYQFIRASQREREQLRLDDEEEQALAQLRRIRVAREPGRHKGGAMRVVAPPSEGALFQVEDAVVAPHAEGAAQGIAQTL